uniref:Uncharacterized protein n=1 Tax=Rhizophora mucronata TaxID=61149 RepID=A0A2P2N3C5_RHIMU
MACETTNHRLHLCSTSLAVIQAI